MATKNDVTGDTLITKASRDYFDKFDEVFKGESKDKPESLSEIFNENLKKMNEGLSQDFTEGGTRDE